MSCPGTGINCSSTASDVRGITIRSIRTRQTVRGMTWKSIDTPLHSNGTSTNAGRPEQHPFGTNQQVYGKTFTGRGTALNFHSTSVNPRGTGCSSGGADCNFFEKSADGFRATCAVSRTAVMTV